MRATGPFVALAWIAACVLGALALLVLGAQALGAFTSPLWMALFAASALAGAALLLLPLLWRRAPSRWITIPRVIVAIMLIYAGLFTTPVTSHAVMLDQASRAAP